ncbi:glutaredoxin-related family protein [Tieghemostelium lacteum]|uniref:Glutaredoxin-related family protein n=1 Tax=Tieghemostelium lacteum TaxID=361077 RepID=A0A151Z3X3_TIELA|nr:glutaredoxin-related family protein [Tieghemostelium lacteum]|eukprot:KYQ88659.1 glutaredoxin-related family protein [Tieghemostelium lacteum]
MIKGLIKTIQISSRYRNVGSINVLQSLNSSQQTLNYTKRCYSSLSDSLKLKIEGQIKEHSCVVYMKGTPERPMCGFSNTVVRILEAEGADFKSHNILEDQELREGIKVFSNWPTLPQVYVKGEFVGGADIMMNMYKSGELSKLLENAGVVEK